MDYIEIEQKLAEVSAIIIANPGKQEIRKLKEYFTVIELSRDQIRITYKNTIDGGY